MIAIRITGSDGRVVRYVRHDRHVVGTERHYTQGAGGHTTIDVVYGPVRDWERSGDLIRVFRLDGSEREHHAAEVTEKVLEVTPKMF